MPKALLVAMTLLAASGLAPTARAFTHVVRSGETLASIAERVYGRIQYEKILVAANALDAQGGVPIVPGMRLEVPAVTYRRVGKDDDWAKLAEQLLGAPHRADVLALSNDTQPWLPPQIGAEILVPYNLRVIVSGTETIMQIAYKYLGDAKKAWVLDRYNGLEGRSLRRGDVLLIPLTDLPLTETGKHDAVASVQSTRSQGGGQTRAAQRSVSGELPALIADVRSGRYVQAIARANRFLAMGDLSRPQQATIHRQLLEAYVALDATGLATGSCNEWKKLDPSARDDEIQLSPKILEACRLGTP